MRHATFKSTTPTFPSTLTTLISYQLVSTLPPKQASVMSPPITPASVNQTQYFHPQPIKSKTLWRQRLAPWPHGPMAQQPGLAAGPQFRCMSAVPPWAAGCYRCWGYRAALERCPANWGKFCCQVPPYLLGFKVSYCCFQGLGSCPTSKTGFARQSCTLSSIRFSDGQSCFLNPSRILTTTLKRFIATNLPILNSCPIADLPQASAPPQQRRRRGRSQGKQYEETWSPVKLRARRLTLFDPKLPANNNSCLAPSMTLLRFNQVAQVVPCFGVLLMNQSFSCFAAMEMSWVEVSKQRISARQGWRVAPWPWQLCAISSLGIRHISTSPRPTFKCKFPRSLCSCNGT